jgi:hypothetical protein
MLGMAGSSYLLICSNIKNHNPKLLLNQKTANKILTRQTPQTCFFKVLTRAKARVLKLLY